MMQNINLIGYIYFTPGYLINMGILQFDCDKRIRLDSSMPYPSKAAPCNSDACATVSIHLLLALCCRFICNFR